MDEDQEREDFFNWEGQNDVTPLQAWLARAALATTAPTDAIAPTGDAAICAQAVIDMRAMLLRLIKYEGMANDHSTLQLYSKTTDALFSASRIVQAAPPNLDKALKF